jgi:hypothetical protein
MTSCHRENLLEYIREAAFGQAEISVPSIFQNHSFRIIPGKVLTLGFPEKKLFYRLTLFWTCGKLRQMFFVVNPLDFLVTNDLGEKA